MDRSGPYGTLEFWGHRSCEPKPKPKVSAPPSPVPNRPAAPSTLSASYDGSRNWPQVEAGLSSRSSFSWREDIALVPGQDIAGIDPDVQDGANCVFLEGWLHPHIQLHQSFCITPIGASSGLTRRASQLLPHPFFAFHFRANSGKGKTPRPMCASYTSAGVVPHRQFDANRFRPC